MVDHFVVRADRARRAALSWLGPVPTPASSPAVRVSDPLRLVGPSAPSLVDVDPARGADLEDWAVVLGARAVEAVRADDVAGLVAVVRCGAALGLLDDPTVRAAVAQLCVRQRPDGAFGDDGDAVVTTRYAVAALASWAHPACSCSAGTEATALDVTRGGRYPD